MVDGGWQEGMERNEGEETVVIFMFLGLPDFKYPKRWLMKRKSAVYRYKTEFPQTRNVLDSDRSDLLATGATCPMFSHPPGLSHRQEARMKP